MMDEQLVVLNKILYVVKAEIKAQKNSLMNTENKGVGGFLHAFVNAYDALDAGKRVKSALEEDNYVVIRIEEIFENSNFEFNDDEYESIIEKAEKSEDVTYGPIFVYDEE